MLEATDPTLLDVLAMEVLAQEYPAFKLGRSVSSGWSAEWRSEDGRHIRYAAARSVSALRTWIEAATEEITERENS